MDMNQPDAGIKLPKDVQAALEAARNNVTMLEAESARLSKLLLSQQRDVNTLHAQHVDYENRITSAASRLAQIQGGIDNGIVKKQGLEQESAAIAKDNEQQARKFDQAKLEYDKRKQELIGRESQLAEREHGVTVRTKELDTHHEAIIAAQTILKTAIDSLTL